MTKTVQDETYRCRFKRASRVSYLAELRAQIDGRIGTWLDPTRMPSRRRYETIRGVAPRSNASYDHLRNATERFDL